MVLIYSNITSSRLQYTCNFIFTELLGVEFAITVDSESFSNYDGVKVNYSDQSFASATLNLSPAALLFETGIQLQPITCFEVNGYKAFFKNNAGDFPFDIFAATFYLFSRYEEYLPHTKDSYGRYAHENALAYKEGFLDLPLINIWVNDFAVTIKNRFPAFNLQHSTFSFLPTYDIDIAYSYKYKGLARNLGGFLASPSLSRIKVLLGLQKDPFDTYAWLNELHRKNNLTPIYFFLLAEKNSVYDKNILPHKHAMWQLVQQHAKKYTVGIHPSWQSGDNDALLKKEIEEFAAMVQAPANGMAPTISRQHYIRFNLPGGYQKLIDAGITDDYSMGYGSINGFRASVANSFMWYDLQQEQQTTLRIHPFCFMDANAFYEQDFSTAQANEELLHYYTTCKKLDTPLITIWHNNFFGTDQQFEGWREMYAQFISIVSSEA